MRRDELKPCPFCGGEAERVDIEDGDNAGGSFVHCTACDASGNVEFGFKENFIANWNRRVTVTAAVKALEWMEDWGGSNEDIPNWRASTPWGRVSVSAAGHRDLEGRGYARHADVPIDLVRKMQADAESHYRDKVLSALVNAQADADVVERWQPIETAPKDGTIILLIGGVYGGLPFPGKWDKSEFVSPVAKWFSSISKGHLYNHVPTHWRPLPVPPSTRIADSAEAGGSATLSKGQADE